MPRRNNPADRPEVFLNAPYYRSYEPVLIALTAALVALGRKPRLTFEIANDGVGRMRCIFDLLRSCPVSFHDLSTVEPPPRFNMPFELGLAGAFKEMPQQYRYHIFETSRHRLDKHLSDLKGIDHKIHNGRPRDAISAVLEVLDKPGVTPTTRQVMQLFRYMDAIVPEIKRRHAKRTIFGRQVFGEIVAVGWEKALELGFHR